jgi:hypothetical protein
MFELRMHGIMKVSSSQPVFLSYDSTTRRPHELPTRSKDLEDPRTFDLNALQLQVIEPLGDGDGHNDTLAKHLFLS